LTVREAKVGKKILVTPFLKPREVSKRDFGKLFLRRWNVELDLRNIKTTLGMNELSCKTPQMCEKELWVYMLAYNLIRMLMSEAAVQAMVLPRELSFKHTVQVWLAWSRQQFHSDAPEEIAALFRLIAQVRVGKHPEGLSHGRSNEDRSPSRKKHHGSSEHSRSRHSSTISSTLPR
jgi:hypothetical protein